MQIKELIAVKKELNHIKTKDIVRELGVAYSTYRNKLNNELINLKELKQLKSLLKISNAELVGIF